MQTIYRFHRLRRANALRYYYGDIKLITPDAQRKYKALQFFNKHGLSATQNF